MAEIEVRDLVKTFGRVTAVRGLSFTAPSGKVTGFLGPNGSGKPVTELRHSLPARQADCRSPVRGHLLGRARRSFAPIRRV